MTTTPPGPNTPPDPNDPYWGGQPGRSAEGPQGPGPQYPPQGSYPPSGGFPQSSDPLVTSDISGWWRAGTEIFQRSWRTVGILMLVGVFIPSLVLGSTFAFTSEPMTATWDGGQFGFSFAGNLFPSFLVGIIMGYLIAAAWSGALRAIVKEAAGQPVSIGESFAYGFRRGVPLWGWGILAYLTVSVGLVLCILPGLYFLVSLSLLAPAATFERGSPYARSFKLVNRNFGGALGRLILAWLVVAVFSCVVSLIGGLLVAAFGLTGAALTVVTLVVNVIVSLVMLLPAVWMVGVVLVTYVWARGKVEPVSTHSLAAQADR